MCYVFINNWSYSCITEVLVNELTILVSTGISTQIHEYMIIISCNSVDKIYVQHILDALLISLYASFFYVKLDFILFIFRLAKNNIDFTVKENDINPCSVYVSGLKDDISRQMLDNYFSKFGCIKDINWNRFRRIENFSKWAIVAFSDAQSAQSAIHEQNHEIGNLCISVCPCRKKNECVHPDCNFNV